MVVKKIMEGIVNPLFFNFNSLFYSGFNISGLIGQFFADFKFFKHTGFDGYLCNTLTAGFCSVFFAVELEGNLFVFKIFSLYLLKACS